MRRLARRKTAEALNRLHDHRLELRVVIIFILIVVNRERIGEWRAQKCGRVVCSKIGVLAAFVCGRSAAADGARYCMHVL